MIWNSRLVRLRVLLTEDIRYFHSPRLSKTKVFLLSRFQGLKKTKTQKSPCRRIFFVFCAKADGIAEWQNCGPACSKNVAAGARCFSQVVASADVRRR